MACLALMMLGAIVVALGMAIAPLVVALLPWLIGIGIAFVVTVVLLSLIRLLGEWLLEHVASLRRACDALERVFGSKKWYVRAGAALAIYVTIVVVVIAVGVLGGG